MRRAHTSHRIPTPVLGAVFIVMFLAGVYLAFTKRVPLVEGYRVQGMFNNSNQLRKGSPVRVAGVDVAKVVKLEHGPGTTAVVTMEFKDSGRPVHTDAELRIRPRLFLEGGFYIEMSPGSPSAPEIRDGGTIPLSQTATPVQFDQVLSGAFARPSRDALRGILDETGTALADGGAEALGKAARPAAPALRDVAIVTKAARGVKTHDVSQTIRSVSRITTALAANERALGGLVTGMARSANALASEKDALQASVRELDTVLRNAPPALRAIDRALPPATALARDLRPGLKLAPPVLRGAVKLLDQLDRATRPAELPGLLKTVRPAINALPTLESRLTTLFPLVDPVTDCVRERVVPVLNTKLDDGALSSNRPVWQDLLHSATGLNSAASTFDGNGHQVRYLFGTGDQSISLGDIPGFGPLLAQGSNPIQGIRPRWNGAFKQTAFHPEAPCRDQPAPKLQVASTAPAVTTSRTVRRRTPKPVSVAKLRSAEKQVVAKLKAGAGR